MRWRGLVAFAATCCVMGCSTSQPAQKTEPPPATYEEAVKRAASAIAEQPKVLRYNPVTCNCPAFEVQLGPRWVRVSVDDIDEPTAPAGKLLARAKAEHAADQLAYYEVLGDLSTRPEYCGQGALFLTLSVDSLAP